MTKWVRVAVALIFTALSCAAAIPKPTDNEKQLAATIASASSPSDAASAHRSEWSPGLALALVAEGVARETKDPPATEALYRLSQRIATAIGDAGAEAKAMQELGALLTRRLAFPEAVALLRKALVIQTAPERNSQEEIAEAAATAVSLTQVLSNSGQVEDAVSVAGQATDLATASGDELLLGRAWSAAGSAKNFQGNNRAAIADLQKALAIAEKLKSLSGQAAVLNNLGIASRRAYDFAAASGYFQRSLDIKRQQGVSARLATTLNNLGELAMVQQHFSEAERWYRQALDSARSPQDDDMISAVDINLGLIAQQQNQLDKALTLFAEGGAIAERLHDVGSLCLVGLFQVAADLQLERLDDAQAHADRVRALASEAGDRELLMRLHMAQGDIYVGRGVTDKAREAYREAIRIYESLRLDIAGDESVQSGFDDKIRYVYWNLIHLEAAAGNTAEAFRETELSKSRVLLDDLLSERAEMTRLLTPAEAETNKTLLARLSDLNMQQRTARGPDRKAVTGQLDALRHDYSSFRTGVYAAHPELELRRADPEPISIAQAAALLPDERTAFVSYSVGSDLTYAFVITRAAGKPLLRVRELKGDSDRLEALVTRWRQQIASRDPGFTSLAVELYTTLIKPLLPELAGKEKLILSPDGALWQIPFEALQDGSGKFLAETREIFYAPSITVYGKMGSTGRKAALSLLAMGDPTGDLPEAAAEVASIGKLYSGDRGKVLFGPGATEAALRTNASKYSVIHIAAHGMYDDARPLYSFLALAPGAEKPRSAADDGNLEAREIMDLHLNARLVVLSGCETARGSGSGNGIAGMSWALFIAGAPATVASLWKVDSRSTSLLMTDLHKSLSQGGSIAKALRDAKLTMLKNPAYRHPFYWAGFIGIGAGN